MSGVDGDGAARDRRPAARAPGSRTYGAPSRARAARLLRRAAARGRPGRVHAAPAGGVGAAAPRARGPGREPGDRRAGPRGLRAPPQDAGRLARAGRAARRARARGAGRAARRVRPPGSASGATRGAESRLARPRTSRPRSAERARTGRGTVLEMLRAPAKLNLCLRRGGRPAGRPPRAALAVLRAGPGRPDRDLASRRATATRSSVRAWRGRTSWRPRWRRCASGAGGGRRCGWRSRSASRSRPGSEAAAPTPGPCCAISLPSAMTSPRSRRAWAPTCRRSCEPGFALVSGAGEVVEPLPFPAEFGVVLIPSELRARGRRGLRGGRPAGHRSAAPRSWRRRSGSCARRRAAAHRRWTYARAAGERPAGCGALAAPRDQRGAGRAGGGGGGARARRRIGPDGLRAVRRHRGGRPSRRRPAAAVRRGDRQLGAEVPASACSCRRRRASGSGGG